MSSRDFRHPARRFRLAAPLLALLLTAGCPFWFFPREPSPTLPALIVNPQTLDFGANLTVLTFTVRKNNSPINIPDLVITSSQAWAVIQNVQPAIPNTQGPSEVVIVTVAVNRADLSVGEHFAQIKVAAYQTASQTVTVRALVPPY